MRATSVRIVKKHERPYSPLHGTCTRRRRRRRKACDSGRVEAMHVALSAHGEHRRSCAFAKTETFPRLLCGHASSRNRGGCCAPYTKLAPCWSRFSGLPGFPDPLHPTVNIRLRSSTANAAGCSSSPTSPAFDSYTRYTTPFCSPLVNALPLLIARAPSPVAPANSSP